MQLPTWTKWKCLSNIFCYFSTVSERVLVLDPPTDCPYTPGSSSYLQLFFHSVVTIWTPNWVSAVINNHDALHEYFDKQIYEQ